MSNSGDDFSGGSPKIITQKELKDIVTRESSDRLSAELRVGTKTLTETQIENWSWADLIANVCALRTCADTFNPCENRLKRAQECIRGILFPVPSINAEIAGYLDSLDTLFKRDAIDDDLEITLVTPFYCYISSAVQGWFRCLLYFVYL